LSSFARQSVHLKIIVKKSCACLIYLKQLLNQICFAYIKEMSCYDDFSCIQDVYADLESRGLDHLSTSIGNMKRKYRFEFRFADENFIYIGTYNPNDTFRLNNFLYKLSENGKWKFIQHLNTSDNKLNDCFRILGGKCSSINMFNAKTNQADMEFEPASRIFNMIINDKLPITIADECMPYPIWE